MNIKLCNTQVSKKKIQFNEQNEKKSMKKIKYAAEKLD